MGVSKIDRFLEQWQLDASVDLLLSRVIDPAIYTVIDPPLGMLI